MQCFLNYRRFSLKLLLLDIETAPNLARVWQLWDQNISIDQIEETDYILCWAAKWLGEEEVMFYSLYTHTQKQMLRRMHKLLDEADAVIHYNGKKFDIPWLNREFLQLGMPPPSPFKQIDLVITVKKEFRFPSNKLDFVSRALGIGQKVKHEGHELWVGCMMNDPACWAKMEEYNRGDVTLLEKLYYVLRPWIKGHINHSLFAEDSFVCPNCGSGHLQKRGFAYTLSSKFQRYVCRDCGHWCKDTKILNRNHYKTTSVQ